MTIALYRVLLGVLLSGSLCAGPLAPREALAQELLQNGGFEDGAAPWSGCGGVSIVDGQDAGTTAAMVRTGRYAARIGGLSDGSCVSAPAFVMVQPVAIPADATALTLSFWFSRLGPDLAPDGNSVADLSVSLSTDPFIGTAFFDVVSHNVLRGWMPFRGNLGSNDLAAFRGQNAYLRFAVHYTGDSGVTYSFDDVSLVAADVRTEAAPLPAGLVSDGSRPLVLLQRSAANPDGLTVVRLDTDGTNAMPIDTGLYNMPRLPRWSPDGSAITVLDDDVSPHDAAVPARITRLSVVGPDGSGRREIFATQGLAGTGGSPPFCRPPNCVEPPGPALDQIIKGVEWSPDGRVIAVTVCVHNRYDWGETGDDSCHVELIDATTGAVIRSDLDGWFRPDWGPAMLFNGPASYPNYELRGVWEGDPSVTPATQQLILPAPLDLLVDGDRLPTWAPDGRHFVTARQIGGYRFDANGFAVRTEAVMLHDHEDLQNPRVLMIADRGGISGAIGDFTWSPDGRWVLYTLYESADAANVWWLDVTTGATGRVTNDGASVSVDWRQRADAGPGAGRGPGHPCAGEAAGVARAACYLAAIASGVEPTGPTRPAARRLLKRVAQSAAAARKKVLQLAKKSPPPARRVVKARKATLAVAGLIERAKTKGYLAVDSADGLAALATAAARELDALP
jgi:WD40-like Beta Propeller Repeat